MNLKNILKNFKLNENNISMLLGAAVIIIVGFLVVNYFKNFENGTTVPTNGAQSEATPLALPTKHIVEKGETLWSIAEKYYKSGYNWVDIQKANNLTNASVITAGQELVIPDAVAMTATVETPAAVAESTPSASPIAMENETPNPTPAVQATPNMEETLAPTPAATVPPTTNIVQTAKIEGTSYEVSHGDNLWKIAERAYGDGFKWIEIAKANKLSHPGVIHAGNVLQIPR